MSAVEGQETASLAVKTFERIRSESSADLFYESVKKRFRNLISSSAEKEKNPKLQKDNGLLQRRKGEPNHTIQRHRKTVSGNLLEALDLIINAISERFNQRSYKIFCAFENLLLNALE